MPTITPPTNVRPSQPSASPSTATTVSSASDVAAGGLAPVGASSASDFQPAQPLRPPVVLSPAPVSSQPPVRLTGTVSQYDWEAGTGYIRPADGGPEVFVHYSGIDMLGYKYLEPGANVTFSIRPGVNGVPEAYDVRQS